MVSHRVPCDQSINKRFFDPKFIAGKNEALHVFDPSACDSFKNEVVGRFSPLSKAIEAEYQYQKANYGYPSAVLNLLTIERSLKVKEINLLCEPSDLNEIATSKAEQCGRVIAKAETQEDAYYLCKKLVYSYQLSSPSQDDSANLTPILNRFSCSKWWKRQLSTLQKERVEQIARRLRLVHQKNSKYSSFITVNRHRYTKKKNRAFLENQIAINEQGDEYSLAQLSDLSCSNPRIRRLELITRCKGFEAIADEFSHVGLFITLTTPSRFHRMTSIQNKGRLIKVIPNKKYDGSTTRDAHLYLTNLWSKIQAKFSRHSIKPYGFRIAEPHHDGTPHWHFLLFCPKNQKADVIEIFKKWSLLDTPDEKGASTKRIKIEEIKKGINPETGNPYTATGYIIKYISKNVDGFGLDNSKTISDAPQTNAERIEAWARVNRIRQFQQIGGPSVTTWRELRRLEAQDGFIESIRQCASEGDWAGFVKAMGGPTVKRKDQTVKPVYALSERLNTLTGEIETMTHTCYGDPAKERVVGVLIAGVVTLSRTHLWTIKENQTVIEARQKIMDGMASLIQEISEQNIKTVPPHEASQTQPTTSAALDLFQ